MRVLADTIVSGPESTIWFQGVSTLPPIVVITDIQGREVLADIYHRPGSVQLKTSSNEALRVVVYGMAA